MNRHSIFLTVSLIFLTALLGVLFSFIFYIKYDLDLNRKIKIENYRKISKIVIPQFGFCTDCDEFLKILDEYDLKPIDDKSKAYYILNNSQIVDKKITPFGSIFLLEQNSKYFIYIQTFSFTMLFEEKEGYLHRYYILGFLFLFIELILVFGYLLLLKRLKPLKTLQNRLIRFGDGELDVKIDINQKDEIGDVALAFSYLQKRINGLINSRDMFLRNIMHEIKTPITKGKIIAEMVEDDKNKQRLNSIFQRLEDIVLEFATVEKLTSGFYNLDFKTYKLKDIIDEAIDLAFVSSENIELDIKEVDIFVDFKLFSIALKNLIDNGIKYSFDKKIKIKCEQNQLIFENSGKRLEHELNYYLVPYTKEGTMLDGFGLGLYIVDFILKLHNLRLEYLHEDGKSKFIIKGILS